MDDNGRKSRVLSDLPDDEIIIYGRELGLHLESRMGRGELLRRIRERQELLLELERESLLDIIVWARRPMRQSASKEELAKEISGIAKMDFHGLSDRGLVALARLRGAISRDGEPRVVIEACLRDAERLWARVRRRRRQWVAGLIDRVVQGAASPEPDAYRFLPEEGAVSSLKERITEEGVVGGIARKIRGVADDYVRQKLDEIEARIDHKLDEIDRRLGEWRDREIANRLKIIKITLVASVLVAVLSLVYNALTRDEPDPGPRAPVVSGPAPSAAADSCDSATPWV